MMANEFYTIIVVPHAKARFRKLQISVKLMKWAGSVSAALSVAIVGVLVHYSMIAVNVGETERLRNENAQLRAENLEYKENAPRLQGKVEYLQSMVTKLGVMAGLEQSLPDARIGGQGGVPGSEIQAPTTELRSLSSMDRDLTTLTDRSVKLEEFYKDQSAQLSSTPSIWPVRGYLSSNFGNRIDPFTRGRDFHPGIDISTPSGTSVQAPADGIVVSAGVKGAYGNAIIIDHGFGLLTRYGHLSGYNVRPGQRVRRGDVIGFVGSTGRSTSPHLHYEVWNKDQNQNPIHYILDEFRSFS
jgi:murein DD-endopeptidase MepM/ murein hydrolase activator NlpD